MAGTAGPCCGGRWVTGYPCGLVLGGEDGPLAARPQAPLEDVEKVLTGRRRGSRCQGSLGS
jgi:hypothetical protein